MAPIVVTRGRRRSSRARGDMGNAACQRGALQQRPRRAPNDAPAIVIPGSIGRAGATGAWRGPATCHRPSCIARRSRRCLRTSAVTTSRRKAGGPDTGRYEAEPPLNRRLPPPAPSYYREWGARSHMLPATVDPSTKLEIGVEAQVDWRRRRHRRHHH